VKLEKKLQPFIRKKPGHIARRLNWFAFFWGLTYVAMGYSIFTKKDSSQSVSSKEISIKKQTILEIK
jgi:hypothetical protein